MTRIKKLSPQATKKDCIEFLRDLAEKKLTYHLEDDPADIEDGNGKILFSKKESEILRHNVALCYERIIGKKECPISVMIDFEDKYNAGN